MTENKPETLLLGNVDSEKLLQASSPYVSRRCPDGHLRPGYSGHSGVGWSPLASDPATSLAHGEVVSDSEVLGQLLCPSNAFTTVPHWVRPNLKAAMRSQLRYCVWLLTLSAWEWPAKGASGADSVLHSVYQAMYPGRVGLVSVHPEQGHLFNRCVKYPKHNIFSQIHDAYWTMVPVSPSIHFINW